MCTKAQQEQRAYHLGPRWQQVEAKLIWIFSTSTKHMSRLSPRIRLQRRDRNLCMIRRQRDNPWWLWLWPLLLLCCCWILLENDPVVRAVAVSSFVAGGLPAGKERTAGRSAGRRSVRYLFFTGWIHRRKSNGPLHCFQSLNAVLLFYGTFLRRFFIKRNQWRIKESLRSDSGS